MDTVNGGVVHAPLVTVTSLCRQYCSIVVHLTGGNITEVRSFPFLSRPPPPGRSGRSPPTVLQESGKNGLSICDVLTTGNKYTLPTPSLIQG